MASSKSVSGDYTQRFIFEDGDVRGEIVHLDKSFQDILSTHHYPPVVAQLLGQFTVAAVLLSTSIKFNGKLSVQARSEGDVPLIMAECSSDLVVRAIAHYSDQAISEKFSDQLRDGVMAITVEPLKAERYQSVVPLQGDDLAQCLMHYFMQSEQLNTYLFFATTADHCVGFMLQQLPSQLENDPQERQERWQRITQLAQTLKKEELLGLDNDDLLYRLYHQEPLRLFDAKPVAHGCSCSSQRTKQALLSLGLAELEDILSREGVVSVNCEFCNALYEYDARAVAELFD